jgi:hypothetical protein
MSRRFEYTDEPIKIGRRVGKEVLPGHGGAREGSGRPALGKKAVTLRLSPKLIDSIRRQAKKAGQTMSDFVAAKLQTRQ